MRIAVVGAGLSGIGVSYFLWKKGCDVTLFDPNGLGGALSTIPIGICHPYPGRSGKLSKFAREAIFLTYELVEASEKALGIKVARKNGILRKGWKPEAWYEDLEQEESGILIRSGITVYLKEYMQGLFSLFGFPLIEKRVAEEDLHDFDRIVFAVGSYANEIDPSAAVRCVKGQVLLGRSEERYEQSILKGRFHFSPLQDGRMQLGSTYERGYASEKADFSAAVDYFSKTFAETELFYPEECRSGIRASSPQGYLPLVKQISSKAFLFTGLGSRGLLYHAYYGRHLANLLL